jgi:dolichyl-phosphate-mannose--protein O-mannosyl transferase
MFKIYSDVLSDDYKIIKYDSETLITIKHVATGRYLSSIDLNYITGSERQVVSIFLISTRHLVLLFKYFILMSILFRYLPVRNYQMKMLCGL